ncbi:MAG TPA: methyltransferase domain-containing protein, partial [Planctomycetota bacterium]
MSADAYARFRPRYPRALFAFLAEQAPARDCACDLATGSGQAAVALAEDFARVEAIEASAAQLAHAQAHPRVRYTQGNACRTGLPDACEDL